MSPVLLNIIAASLPFLGIASAVGPTSVFINQVPEYSLLSKCAEVKLSTIVRNMEFGCGDNSKTTSFACFCYQSSAVFSSMIGRQVSSACTRYPAQNASALEVFSKYCELGHAIGVGPSTSLTTSLSISSTSASASVSSASPASTRDLVSATSTPTPTPTQGSISSPAPKSKNKTVRIAVGVSVPLGVLAIICAGLFVWWGKKRSSKNPVELGVGREMREKIHEVESPLEVHELRGNHDIEPVEIGGNARLPA